MEINISPMFKCHIDTETQLMKLSAWLQTLSFVLEGMDKEGRPAKATLPRSPSQSDTRLTAKCSFSPSPGCWSARPFWSSSTTRKAG